MMNTEKAMDVQQKDLQIKHTIEGSVWVPRIDNQLMSLMITMGDVDLNLCYKVEYGFYTQMTWMQEGTHHIVRMILRLISVEPSDERWHR